MPDCRAIIASAIILCAVGCVDEQRTLGDYCGKQPAVCAPVNVTPPRIEGELLTGRVVSAVGDEWTSDVPFSRQYLWRRCCDPSSCDEISGATLSNYLLGGLDVECRMAVTVTATSENGFSATATSAQSDPVEADLLVGSVVAIASNSLPEGWLWADGSSGHAQADYPELFALIGQTYGGGAETFAVPDLGGTFLLGAGATGPIGEKRGSLDHGHSVNAAAHSHTALVPVHSHDAGSIAHSHNVAPKQITQYGAIGTSSVLMVPAAGSWTTTTTGAPVTVVPVPSTPLTTTLSSHTGTSTRSTALPPHAVLAYAIRARTNAVAPCGAVLFSAAAQPEDGGVLLAEGAATDRTQYAYVFDCVGTAFGFGDGISTFNLPDLRGRFAIGRTGSGLVATVGMTGGSDQHSHTVQEFGAGHTLDVPPHSHFVTREDHSHSLFSAPTARVACGSTPVSAASFINPTINTTPPINTVQGASVGEAQLLLTAPALATVSSSIATVTPPYLDLSATLMTDVNSRVPPGTIVPYLSAEPPRGWMRANGAPLERARYPRLFNAIGTRFGAPDALTFNLPDLSERFPRGATSAPDSIGQTGGALLHSHSYSVMAHAHSVTIPAHSHTWSIPAHSHVLGTNSSSCFSSTGSTFSTVWDVHVTGPSGAATTTVNSPAATLTSSNDVTSGALSDEQIAPSFTVAYIIKY